MNLIKKVKRARKLYKSHINEINQENHKTASMFYIFASILWFGLFICSTLIPSMNNLSLTYGICFACLALFTIPHFTFFRKHKKYVWIDIYILELIVVIASIILGTVFCPNDTAVIFIILLIIFSVVFIKLPPTAIYSSLFYAIVFIILCVIVKPMETYIIDILNTMIALFIACFFVYSLSFSKIENINLISLLKHNSSFDELTGLQNRRALNIFLEKNNSSFENKDEDLSVIIFDIDNFKLYNDTYGHLQGDICLEEISNVIASTALRNNLESFRYGGEEFLIILQKKDCKFAEKIAKEIIISAQNLKMENAKAPFKFITISAGISSKKRNKPHSISELINMADTALYTAKNSGKNCYAVAYAKRKYEIETI